MPFVSRKRKSPSLDVEHVFVNSQLVNGTAKSGSATPVIGICASGQSCILDLRVFLVSDSKRDDLISF